MSLANTKPPTAQDDGGSTDLEEQPEEGMTTTISEKSEIPNGGFQAWLQVAGAFFLFFNTWGVVNSYGVFQTFYQTGFLSAKSPSNISWIGSTQVFLLLFGAAASGPLFDMGYLRSMLVSGTFFVVFGMMMTSLCTAYWQIFLAQGVTVGLGFACLFLPSLAIVPQYFTTKKAFAAGIVSTGGSIGGVVFPVAFRQLEPRIGFGWATRVMSFIILVTCAVPVLGMRRRTPPSTKMRDFLDLAAFRAKPFLIFSSATFFCYLSVYVVFFYIQLYALEQTDIDIELSSYLLSIINATSTFGRLLPNFLADKVGPLNVQTPFALAAAILCFGWIGIKGKAGLVAFCALYGFLSGTFISLQGSTVISLSTDLSKIGIQLGMGLVIAGFGSLVGEPIAGAILRGQGGWPGLQAWCAIILVIFALFCLAARIAKVGPRIMARA